VSRAFDVAAARARCEAATPGEWRLLPSEEVEADPIVTERGCVYVARLGGLGVDGRPVWALIGPLYPMSAMGPYSDGDFIAHARTDLPAALDEIEALKAESAAIVAILHREAAKQARLTAEARARGLDDVADRLACGEAVLQCVLAEVAP
jgi:hypothetical protein